MKAKEIHRETAWYEVANFARFPLAVEAPRTDGRERFLIRSMLAMVAYAFRMSEHCGFRPASGL